MAKREIEGTAVVRKVTHQAGGSVIVLENARTAIGDDLLKELAKTKAKEKVLVNYTLDRVQKTLIDEES